MVTARRLDSDEVCQTPLTDSMDEVGQTGVTDSDERVPVRVDTLEIPC